MRTFDIDWVRSQFPALAVKVNGYPAAYFDGPGGTQVPQRVIDAMANYLASSNANTHGAFATSQRTDEVIAEAHAAMADLLGCDADEVVFGPNMTTLTFALSRALGRELKPGDEIVVTRLDHDANFSPWTALEERGCVIHSVDIGPADCTLDMDDLRRKVTPCTRVVAVGYASNSVGTINDVEKIVRLAHAVGALAYIDAVHYAPHGPIDVRKLDCDFLVCSPYKFFGPHSGVLYGKREHLLRLRPYKVRPATESLPGRWETGTQNHEGMAGVTAAVEYLADLGRRHRPAAVGRRAALLAAYDALGAYERTLLERLVPALLRDSGPHLLRHRRACTFRATRSHRGGAHRRPITAPIGCLSRRARHVHVGRQLLCLELERTAGGGTRRRNAEDRPRALQHGRGSEPIN